MKRNSQKDASVSPIRKKVLEMAAKKCGKKTITHKPRIKLISKRKELGITQKELAKAIGCNINTISSIEKDASYDPRLSMVKKICEVYGDTVENLFW